MPDHILEVRNLKKYFKTPRGMLHAVDDVSFDIERGTTVGVVGESGCGKSTLGRCLLQLIRPTSGSVTFNGQDILNLSGKQQRALTKKMQIVFQDPFSSLDPRKSILQTIREPLLVHGLVPRGDNAAIERRVLEIMNTVGLADRFLKSYPHELDGGRRQRVGIARALAMEPELIVCDEPVSALDVSIQAQILNLLKKLQQEKGLTYFFITHDLSVVNYFADEIIVMYLGQIVEKADSYELFANPIHPYTKALLSANLSPVIGEKRERILLKGELTSPIDPADCCRFAKRCNQCCETCMNSGAPALREVAPGHFVACHLA